MKITLSDEQSAVRWTKELDGAVVRALEAAAREEGIDFCVSLLLTDDAGIAALNREYRGVDGATDVLSFPAYTLCRPLKDSLDEIRAEREDGLLFIGDIAVSAERAQAQAAEYGHSLTREAAFLVLHGALHLLGYDHRTPEGEETMLEKQRVLLESVQIGRETDD